MVVFLRVSGHIVNRKRRAVPDAQHGAGGHSARAEHEPGASKAQDLPIPAAGHVGDARPNQV